MKKTALLCLLALLIGAAAGLTLNLSALKGEGLLKSEGGIPLEAPPQGSPVEGPAQTANDTEPQQGNAALLMAGEQVLDALQSDNVEALAALVDTERGVTFTPYSTVDSQNDLTFLPDQLVGAATSGTQYAWGYTSGKGDAIRLTLPEYMKSYVYNAEYSSAPMIGVDHVIASGNSLENVATAYPDAHFVEYYFPGRTPAAAGLDWCALKLVFAQDGGSWKLVGIIHSEWTI